MRKFYGIPLEGAVGGTGVEGPAVVDVEMVVAGSEEAAGEHGVGGEGEEGFVQGAFEACPIVEAHWGSGEHGFGRGGEG